MQTFRKQAASTPHRERSKYSHCRWLKVTPLSPPHCHTNLSLTVSVLQMDSSPHIPKPANTGLLPQGLPQHTRPNPTAPQLSHAEMSTHRTVFLAPAQAHTLEHTALQTHRGPNTETPQLPNTPNPSGTRRPALQLAGGQVSSGQQRWMQPGVRVKKHLDALIQNIHQPWGWGEKRTPGEGEKKLNPDPKLFSSKSMYFSIILLGI